MQQAIIIISVLVFNISLTSHFHFMSPSGNKSYENDNKTYSIEHHNSEFCSACRLDGKVNKNYNRNKINTYSSILLINQIEESYNNLHIKLLNDSRAPPYFS